MLKKRNVSRVLVPLVVALVLHGWSGHVSARDTQRPNVLFIAIDDLKPTIGAYGDRMAITPNIDRLAGAGTVFLNNHCQKAICGASRASLMTGLRPDTSKVWFFGQRMREINPDSLSLPEHFKNHGYETTAIGKIYDPRNVNDKFDPPSWSMPHKSFGDYRFHPDHLGLVNGAFHNPASKRADAAAEAKGIKGYLAMRDFLVKRDAWPSTECLDLPDNAYTDGAIALRAIELLQELDRADKPFFLGVGFAKPHLPFVAPKKYWDLYDRDAISAHHFQGKSSDPVDLAYHGSGELKSYSDIPRSMDSYSKDRKRWLAEDKQRELIHGYYACISYVDTQIGKVLEALERAGLAKDTIVVLWGDHGFHLGDHGLWHKHTNFEQATRSPLIIRVPGYEAQATTVPTEFIDIFPTLCELSGLPTPAGLDGESLTPAMRDPSTPIKPFAVSQYSYKGCMGYSIRTEQFRYTEWIQNWRTRDYYDPSLVRGRELYDYKTDYWETKNLAADPGYQRVLKSMQQQLHAFFDDCRQKTLAAR